VSPVLRGHFLLFDQRKPPGYSATAGLRLLVIVAVLELVIGPRAWLLDRLGVQLPPAARLVLLFTLCLVAVRLWAKVRLEDIGFLAWREWTATERWYFAQVVPLAIVIFGAIHAAQLAPLTSRAQLWSLFAAIVVVELAWGFYQELIYRAILQTELTRRWGAVAGVLVANLLFTFGPLHFYHFTSGRPWLAIAAILAATFAIGLFFAFIFHRTRNLWIVGTFHGIGNAFINGAAAAAALAPWPS
jgi:membrane protease YdiL (CAAX protease family)